DLLSRPALQGLVQLFHAFDGPEEIDGGRAGPRERVADFFEAVGGVKRAKRDAHRRCNADRGRSADDHGPDGVGHLAVGAAGDVHFLAWQSGLIDHHHTVVGPLNRLYHVCGALLPPAKNPRNKVRLYAECMTVEPRVEREIQRIHPKPAPASVMSAACCHVNPYCGRCSRPNPMADSVIPGTTPSERMNSGCMNPRNASSSHIGPSVMPNRATAIS